MHVYKYNCTVMSIIMVSKQLKHEKCKQTDTAACVNVFAHIQEV